MEGKSRCYKCMELKTARFRICPYCGYAEDTPYDADYAPPGTELSERYILGVKLGNNSEGANYVGYDLMLNCKVLIREYMPIGMCKRVRGRATISVFSNKVVQYKALMSEFTELHRSLAQMRNLPHIMPPLDILSTNNSTYVVSGYLEGIKLVEYLKENAGELTWRQVSELFPTFFTTLSLMHNNNIIHRAISPETIYVTAKKELRLCGFSIYAVRTVQLELQSEIFHGYAAPEQYTPGAKQGTFTDVYGICAVLYRILTGCKPTEATSRIENDNLCEPYEMNPNIPKSVSKAIMKGLALNVQERTQTITELVTELFEQEETSQFTQSRTTVTEISYHAQNKSEKQEHTLKKENLPAQENIIERTKTPLVLVIILLCILLIVLIIILSMMRSGSVTIQNQNQPTEDSNMTIFTTENNIITESDSEFPVQTEATGDSQMPTLIGTSYDVQKQRLEADGWLYLEPVYVYDDIYKAGIIIDQEIEAGQPFQSGSVIKVVVSQGPASIIIPDYQGKSLMQYEEELEALGMTNANYYTEAIVNYSYENGQVVELNRTVGESFDLSGQDTLKIFYASNPETTVVIVTETIPTEPITEPTTEEPTEETTEPDIQTAPPVIPTEDNNLPQDLTQEAPATAPILDGFGNFQTAPPFQD
ncbi:MAG: PASTA domain-containing protein [Oscillospiraceae bacterium]|nr:PASTA domain-containing protein [Oscillospiraceae bacterium]